MASSIKGTVIKCNIPLPSKITHIEIHVFLNVSGLWSYWQIEIVYIGPYSMGG